MIRITHCIALFGMLFCLSAQAEIAIIAHSSVMDTVTVEDIERIYLGKNDRLPGGVQVVPISLQTDMPQRNEFNEKVLQKSDNQLRAYWSKLIFTGKGQPPKQVDSDAEVIALIKENPNMIGYIDAGSITDEVSVIGRF